MSLVVGDGTIGLPDAIGEVFGDTPLQICLWHLCQDLMRNVTGMSYRDTGSDFIMTFGMYSTQMTLTKVTKDTGSY